MFVGWNWHFNNFSNFYWVGCYAIWSHDLPKELHARNVEHTIINNVVTCQRFDLSEGLICQNPELASKLEYRAPRKFANVASVGGREWFSRCTIRLSFVKCTHTQAFPPIFGITTIGTDHSVGSSTRNMTLLHSILCNSRSVSLRRENGTCRSTVTAYRVGSCVTLMSYSWLYKK